MGSYTGGHNASIIDKGTTIRKPKYKCRLGTASNEIIGGGGGGGASTSLRSTNPRPEFCLDSSDT